MKRGPRAAALVFLLLAGCGATSNEEAIKGADQAPADATPTFKTYGEYQLWKTEQIRKERGKGKGRVKSAAQTKPK